MWSATLNTWAMIVSPGIDGRRRREERGVDDEEVVDVVGAAEGSSTESRGFVPNTTVPHWCVVFRLPCECLTTAQNPSRRRIRLVFATRIGAT